MNTKLALSLLVAVCAVTAIIASFAVSRPAMTQSDTPQPTSTPVPPQTPPATLEPLTPDEFHELVGSVCNAVEVRSLRADLDGDTLELDWRTSHYSGPHLGPRYHGYEIGYRIERRREASNDAEANWDLVAEVTYRSRWSEPAEPGHWLYRVAVWAITKDGQTLQCEGTPDWREIAANVPTAAERAQAEAQRQVLLAEATRCAKVSLTANVAEEALPVVTAQIEAAVAERFAEKEGPEVLMELTELTLTLCSGASGSDEGASELTPWIAVRLFGPSF